MNLVLTKLKKIFYPLSFIYFFFIFDAELSLGIISPASREILELCQEMDTTFFELTWKTQPCLEIPWRIAGKSVMGRPLVYVEYGNPTAKNTTLILAMVHGDEVTPLYLGVQLIHWLKSNSLPLDNSRVVVAPLVNPDGFFKKPRTRMNQRGVDPNRNFPTDDWEKLALMNWKRNYRSDPRRFPGHQAGSEPETQFQESLIRTYAPKKILSIHAPLNFLDYDGPTSSNLSLKKFSREYVKQCLKLREKLKAVSSGFFPGSLGNYGGKKMGIPTITLELPSAKAEKAEQYWGTFQQGIRMMIEFQVSVQTKVQPH